MENASAREVFQTSDKIVREVQCREQGRFYRKNIRKWKDNIANANKRRRVEVNLNTNPSAFKIDGRRIVEKSKLTVDMRCNNCDLPVSFRDLVKEFQHGLASIFSVRCMKCDKIIRVRSSKQDESKLLEGNFHVNSKAAIVTGTTSGNAHRPELSDWTKASSTERSGSSSTRFSRGSHVEHETSGRPSDPEKLTLGVVNDFDATSVNIEITSTTASMISKNIRSGSEFSISEGIYLSNRRKKNKSTYQNDKWSQEFNDENIRPQVHFKISKKRKANDERGPTSSILTNPSINENQSKSLLNVKKSTTFDGKKVTWMSSPSSIIDTPFKDVSLVDDQSTTRSVSLYSSSSVLPPPLLTLTTPLSNDLPVNAIPHRSQKLETRFPTTPRYSKSTQVATNSISIRTSQNFRLDRRVSDHVFDDSIPFSSQIKAFPDVSGSNSIALKRKQEETPDFSSQVVHGKPRKFRDADSTLSNFPIPAERNVEVFISSPNTPRTKSEILPVDASLLVEDLLKSSAGKDENDESTLIDTALVSIATSSNSGDYDDLKKLDKLLENNVFIAGSPEKLRVPVVKEEQLERSTSQVNTEKVVSSSSKYEGGKFDWFSSEQRWQSTPIWQNTAVGFPKRYMRDAPSDNCEKFMITDDVKREFYSPNYPHNYPPNCNCVRTLEAEKGMLLKLDFRDRFELEAMTPVNDKIGECRFDYLEVRDGQYGFSNLLGIFCGTNFPPEIISKSRYLWLQFHSDDTIEYQGFKAVWSTVPRPTSGGVPPEQEPCIKNVTNKSEAIVGIDDVHEEKKIAEQYKVALDCLWIITAPANSRMQLTFDTFKLDKPNDCSANFLDIFDRNTDVPSRLKNFCGSIAEAVGTVGNTMYIRFYLEPKAINGSFKSLITVVRDKGSTDKPCNEDEYDCDDATCIALSLRCNNRFNCRFLRDEDAAMCGTASDQFDSSRVVVILVIFSLIMFGMCFAFVFNCVRKLMRDHRIIKEHIRQSRENRLDEIGRKMTPCPVSLSRTDLRDHRSESPSVEVDSSRELIPATSLIPHEYTKELVLEMKYGTKEINDIHQTSRNSVADDIHQSNNVSNATQERLQESSEELEMCDSSCQTRESLFEPRIPDAILGSPAFSTFGYRRSSSARNDGPSTYRGATQSEQPQHHHYNQRQHQYPPARQNSQQSTQSHPSNSPPSRHAVSERCSVCMSSTSREGSMVICPKHNPIPAPPGWSLHEPPYPQMEPPIPGCPEGSEYMTYQRYQSQKTDRGPITISRSHQQQQHHHSPVFTRQNTVGSGERYGSFICGSGRASSNTASNTTTTSNITTSGSQHSAASKHIQPDPNYRAEAVIEVDQKRPFSMESTKSAPDVIATH